MSWFVYTDDLTSPKEVSAIVLIDELEQHLHPQWQRTIISQLREHLPKVQFLITSHSPLIASSVTGLDEEGWREKLIHFGRNDDGSVVPTESEFLRGMSVQQVLASPAFDYLIDAEPSVAAIYAEASRLASKGKARTSEENERYQWVKRIVGEMLANQDTTLVEREARHDLTRQTQEKISELEKAIFGEER
jgi:predicted ATP-binding protein involved in virulence